MSLNKVLNFQTRSKYKYIWGGPKNLAQFFVRLNFIKYSLIYEINSQSESEENL